MITEVVEVSADQVWVYNALFMYVVCLLFYVIGGGYYFFYRSRLADRLFILYRLTSQRGTIYVIFCL